MNDKYVHVFLHLYSAPYLAPVVKFKFEFSKAQKTVSSLNKLVGSFKGSATTWLSQSKLMLR